MLLAIDIGNSAIKLGVFEKEKLIKKLTLPTVRDQTAAEIGVSLQNELNYRFESIVVSSVVPELNPVFREFAENRFHVTPFFVGNTFDFGLAVKYDPPSAAGTDRLIAAFAAREKYGAPVIVCSFGTATTIDVVNAQNEYLGGIIAPGVATLSDALYLKTSQLPRVEIEKPASVIGASTVACIQAGIFYGYIGLTEGILSSMFDELGIKPCVVATGGFAALIANDCDSIETIDEHLMLDGLRLIDEKISGEKCGQENSHE